MARVVAIGAGGGNYGFGAPIVQRGGRGYDTQAMVASMMAQDNRNDDTGTLLALLQFVQGQDASAAARSQFSERLAFERERAGKADELLAKQLGMQQSQVDAAIGNMFTQNEMLRQQMNEARMARLAENKYRHEQSQFANRMTEENLGLQKLITNLQADVTKSQMKTSEDTRTLGALTAVIEPQHNAAMQGIADRAASVLASDTREEAKGKIATAAAVAPPVRSLDTLLGQLGEISVQGYGRDVRNAPELARQVGALVSRIGSEVFPVGADGKVKVDPIAAETAKPVLEQARAAILSKPTQSGTSYGFGVSSIGRLFSGEKAPSEKLKDTIVSQIDSMIYQLDKFGGASSGELRRLDRQADIASSVRRANAAENQNVQGVRDAVYSQILSGNPAATTAMQRYSAATSRPASDAIRDPAGSGGTRDPLRTAVDQYIMQPW